MREMLKKVYDFLKKNEKKVTLHKLFAKILHNELAMQIIALFQTP